MHYILLILIEDSQVSNENNGAKQKTHRAIHRARKETDKLIGRKKQKQETSREEEETHQGSWVWKKGLTSQSTSHKRNVEPQEVQETKKITAF